MLLLVASIAGWIPWVGSDAHAHQDEQLLDLIRQLQDRVERLEAEQAKSTDTTKAQSPAPASTAPEVEEVDVAEHHEAIRAEEEQLVEKEKELEKHQTDFTVTTTPKRQTVQVSEKESDLTEKEIRLTEERLEEEEAETIVSVTVVEPADQGREDIAGRRLSKLGAATWTPETDQPHALDLLDLPIKLSLLGYVKLDVMHDFGAVGLADDAGFYNKFITGQIPPDGTAAAERTNRTGFTANHTRFSLGLSTPTPLGSLGAFGQVQFNKNPTGPPAFRLRQAYFEIGNLLAGRAWSTFSPTAPMPSTLDYEGANAIPEIRQAQLRWTQPLPTDMWTKGAYVTLGIEEPSADLTLPAGASSLDQMPDVVLRLEYRPSWTSLYLSGIYRRLRAKGNGFDGTADGWGVSLSGSIDTIGSDSLQFGVVAGEGLGHYVQDMQGFGLDAAPAEADSTELRAIPVVSGWLGYQHWWTQRLRSTAAYGHIHLDSDFVPIVGQGVPASAGVYESTNYASVNLLWSPLPPLDFGIEYLWGNRETTDGRRGQDSRLQMSGIFYFGAGN